MSPNAVYIRGCINNCNQAFPLAPTCRLRMAQLRDEGAARLRVLEAELALHSQERHMRQQEHQIRMEILMEKLKRIREGAHVKD